MKFSRSIVFSGIFLAVVPLSASAFVTTFPLGTFAPVGTEIAGKDGWSISDPGFDGLWSQVPDGSGSAFPLSFSNTLNSSVCAELGGFKDAPLAASPTSVFLSHDAAGELRYTSFSIGAFAIAGSTEVYPNRDGFGFALRDSGDNNLISVLLVPVTGGAGDAYRVAYTVGAGPVVNAADSNGDPMYIYQNGLYSMSMTITPAGINPTFSATISGSSSQTFTGIATGLGSASVSRFGALWNVDPPIGSVPGDNGILFDNLSVIPESSTALLAGLASLGLLRRRRVH